MKIEGFGDYDFSKAELKAARLPGGGYNTIYLWELTIWSPFKTALKELRRILNA